METLIDTGKSQLNRYNCKDINIEDCVLEIKDSLIENPEVTVFGKKGKQHRDIGFFSNTSSGYKYSKQIAIAQPLNCNLKNLLEKINEIFDIDFNGILVNRYKSGEDYIGAHSDDERDLTAAGVLIISYGAVRKFRIRNKTTKKKELDVLLQSGEIIQMVGDFQKEFTHEIPVEKKVTMERYSFTFRKHEI